jgi:sugar phosphate isomerase/epimerase
MRFGICGSIDMAGDLKAGGADFLEENVQNFLQGTKDDAEWDGAQRGENSPLLVEAANVLLPGSLKITGPTVDFEAVRRYMANIMHRAHQTGIKILVFGSAGARNVPDGFDRATAREQITQFLTLSARLAGMHGVTLVVEPLNRGESNIINSVADAMSYVRVVNHPHVQCLVDSYHFWLEGDSLDDLKAAMPWIHHVHVADKAGRVPPGESGQSDYGPFFRVIKQSGYNGRVSVETPGYADYKSTVHRVLSFLRKQWQEA